MSHTIKIDRTVASEVLTAIDYAIASLVDELEKDEDENTGDRFVQDLMLHDFRLTYDEVRKALDE